MNAAAENQDAITHLFGESAAEVGNVFVEFATRLNDELGSGGRRGGADVGDKIGNGEIGFVPDAGDNGNLGVGDGACDDLFVEGPQIFERAAAADEHQHVHELFGVEEFQGFDDF